MPALAILLSLTAAVPAQVGQGSADANAGRLEGTAVISSRLAAPRARARVYTEPGSAPAAAPAPAAPLTNVVLYLEPAPALRQRSATPQPAPVMRQRGLAFAPRIIAVRTGATVEFPNEDPVFHNVFSLSRARTFDLGRYPRGQARTVRFDRPGVVQVFCHIHADMSAYIVVVDHPFFVIPDASGRFAMDGIPPGEYRLVAWHERIRPIVTPITITAGRTTSLEVRIPFVDSATAR